MDGGGKLLTAVLLVACGALGALVFSRDDAAPAAATIQTYGHSDTLVRRTTGPITLDLGQESAVVVPDSGPPNAVTPSQASASGRPAAPIDARPLGRLASEFPPTSGLAPLQTVDAYRAASEFAAPSSSLTESSDGRRPLSNLLSAPQLPERFPGPEFETDPPVAPRPAPSPVQSHNSRPLLGPPITTGASAAAPSSPGRMTPISSTVRSGQAQEAAPQTAVAAEAPPPAVAAPRRFVPLKRHTVRDGDTLADLSRRYYGDDSFAAALFEANRGVLSSPDLLPIGAVLTIPAREWADADPTSGAAASGSTTPAAVLVPKPEFNAFGAPPTSAAPAAPTQP